MQEKNVILKIFPLLCIYRFQIAASVRNNIRMFILFGLRACI